MNAIDRIITWFFHGFRNADKGIVFSHGSEPSAVGRILRIVVIICAIFGFLLYVHGIAEVTTDVTDTVREKTSDGLTQLWYEIESYSLYFGEILKYIVGSMVALFVVVTIIGRLSGGQLAALIIIVIVIAFALIFTAPLAAILWNVETQLRTTMSGVIETVVRIVIFVTLVVIIIVIAPLFESKRKVYSAELTVINTMSFAQGVLFFLVVVLGITFIIVAANRISETKSSSTYVTSGAVSNELLGSTSNMEQVTKIISALHYAQGKLNFDNGENNYLPADLIRVARKQLKDLKGLHAEGEEYLNYAEKHLYVVQYRQACNGSVRKSIADDWTRSYNELHSKDIRAMDELTNSLKWIKFKCKH